MLRQALRNKMDSNDKYTNILRSRELFNEFVYTPLSVALKVLDERRKDPVILAKIDELLKGDIPQVLKDFKCGVQFRQIATPNHDARHFISIAEDNNLKPVFFEYLDDKFTSNNEFKHSLGQLHLQGQVNKSDYYPVEKVSIIDFNNSNGRMLKDVVTLWEEPLRDFHQKLFTLHDYVIDDITFYDASEWFHNNGSQAVNYYTNFFLLFICNGILFENFLLNDDSKFTETVVLPAIDNVISLTGFKPMIVPIGPLDIETDMHWISYHPKIKTIIK